MTDCATLAAALKAMTLAATVYVSGVCPAYLSIHQAPDGTVLDLSAATVSRLDLFDLTGITVQGFSTTAPMYAGINVTRSSRVTVIGPRCVDPGTACINITLSDQVDVAAPWVTGSYGDGIDISGSTRVNIHDGACEGNHPTAIHPDCVQVWSLQDHPAMHVTVQRMTAIGSTQGFDAWDWIGGSTDVRFLDNTAAIDAANCVGAINVTGLLVTGNHCRTLPGAKYGPARLDIRTSPDAVITGNEP